ncbi:MAG TPA: SWIM zinc finger family protein [Candidatus Tectomicrobia bacterium]
MRTVPQSFNGHNHLVLPAMTTPPALPESPCSVNVFFEIEGYGRAQATGRGLTADEAASNLRETVMATKKALEAPPVVSMEARLGALITCGMQRATKKGDWALVEKLANAAAIVLSGAVEPGEREGLTAVRSQKNPETWYSVEENTCTCPAWEHAVRKGEKQPCKHVLAAHLSARLKS